VYLVIGVCREETDLRNGVVLCAVVLEPLNSDGQPQIAFGTKGRGYPVFRVHLTLVIHWWLECLPELWKTKQGFQKSRITPYCPQGNLSFRRMSFSTRLSELQN